MIGSTLQSLLKEKNMKVSDLSKLTGVNQQTLYSIIKRDNMKVDLEVLIKISNALCVDVEVFYTDFMEQAKKETPVSGNLSDSESILLSAFRSLDPSDQDSILNLIERLQKLHE